MQRVFRTALTGMILLALVAAYAAPARAQGMPTSVLNLVKTNSVFEISNATESQSGEYGKIWTALVTSVPKGPQDTVGNSITILTSFLPDTPQLYPGATGAAFLIRASADDLQAYGLAEGTEAWLFMGLFDANVAGSSAQVLNYVRLLAAATQNPNESAAQQACLAAVLQTLPDATAQTMELVVNDIVEGGLYRLMTPNQKQDLYAEITRQENGSMVQCRLFDLVSADQDLAALQPILATAQEDGMMTEYAAGAVTRLWYKAPQVVDDAVQDAYANAGSVLAKTQLVELAGGLESELAVTLPEQALGDADATVRKAATEALREVGTYSVNPEHKTKARQALEKSNLPEAKEALLKIGQ